MIDTDTLDSMSRMRAFIECQEKFRLQYIERLRPKQRGSGLWLGSLAHGFMDRYYSGSGLEAAKDYVFQEIEKAADATTILSDAERLTKDAALLMGMMDEYPIWAAREDQGMTVLAVEQDHEFLGVRYRVDMLVERRNTVYIMEHKTSALGFEQRYIDQARFDLQPSLYAAGCRASGIAYNLVLKPAIRQRIGETRNALAIRMRAEYKDHAKYFKRFWIPLATNTPEKVGREVGNIRNLYRALISATGSWPRNSAACFNYGRQCEYLPLCAGGVNTEDLYETRQEQ